MLSLTGLEAVDIYIPLILIPLKDCHIFKPRNSPPNLLVQKIRVSLLYYIPNYPSVLFFGFCVTCSLLLVIFLYFLAPDTSSNSYHHYHHYGHHDLCQYHHYEDHRHQYRHMESLISFVTPRGTALPYTSTNVAIFVLNKGFAISDYDVALVTTTATYSPTLGTSLPR